MDTDRYLETYRESRNAVAKRISPRQCRCARAFLSISISEFAKLANVGKSTVFDFENGRTEPRHDSMLFMIRAFEKAGVAFIEGDGIQKMQYRQASVAK